MVFSVLHLCIIVFLAAGLAFASGPLITSWLIAPRLANKTLLAPYECGLAAQGQARVCFGVSYFFYALIFLAFDVDVLYLFPAAARFNLETGWGALAILGFFVLTLLAAVAYFNRLGVFTWPRRIDF